MFRWLKQTWTICLFSTTSLILATLPSREKTYLKSMAPRSVVSAFRNLFHYCFIQAFLELLSASLIALHCTNSRGVLLFYFSTSIITLSCCQSEDVELSKVAQSKKAVAACFSSLGRVTASFIPSRSQKQTNRRSLQLSLSLETRHDAAHPSTPMPALPKAMSYAETSYQGSGAHKASLSNVCTTFANRQMSCHFMKSVQIEPFARAMIIAHPLYGNAAPSPRKLHDLARIYMSRK